MFRTPSSPALGSAARELRREPTCAEEVLWQRLRGRKFCNLKFRRQVPIDRFVVDFLCPNLRLVVEVDGEIHRTQADRDEARSQALRALGFLVVRFSNERVLREPDLVLRDLEAAIRR